MAWLLVILHLFIGASVAGSFVIAALTMGYDAMVPILIAAGAGFIIGFPLSWVVTKRLYDKG